VDLPDIRLKTQKSINVPAVAIIVYHQDQYLSLLSSGLATAEAHHGILTAFLVSLETDEPDWFSLPPEYSNFDIELKCITGEKVIKRLLKKLKLLNPLLVGMALAENNEGRRYLAGKNFEPLLQQLTCPVYLLKSEPEWVFEECDSAFVPFWDDTNTRFAITTALNLDPNLKITAGKVISPAVDSDEREMQQGEFENQTKRWAKNPRFKIKLLDSFDEKEALLKEAENYDFLLTGASKGNQLARTLFGDYRNQLVKQAKGPAVILREFQGKGGKALFKGWSFLDQLLPTLSREDRIEAYRVIRRAGRPNRDFYSMSVLSSAIASLGLILNSAAVIIGAMLVAPLMSAITGMGMAIIHGDLRFLILTSRALTRGAAMAILTGFLLGLINFSGEPTQQILQRTEPST